MYTWGAFGSFRINHPNTKQPQYSPKQLDLAIMQDQAQRVYAVEPSEEMIIPDSVGRLNQIDAIVTLQSIDWGTNHAIFVDRRNRIFTMGHNRYGKTGLGLTIVKNKPFQKLRTQTSVLNATESGQTPNIDEAFKSQKFSRQETKTTLQDGKQDSEEEVLNIDPISYNLIQEKKKTKSKKGPYEDKWTLVPTMIQNFSPEDRVSDIVCGSGHSLAITQKGRVYAWGEGFKGKLGLGFSEKL